MAAGTPATKLLVQRQVVHTLHSYEQDPRGSSLGEQAAAALGVAPERLFKTLIASVDGTLMCAVVPASRHLDLKALARAVGARRAAMADPAAAQRATGYLVGGISPLGQRSRLAVVIDESALDFETMFVSAGRRGLQVELQPTDLVRLSAAITAPISG